MKNFRKHWKVFLPLCAVILCISGVVVWMLTRGGKTPDDVVSGPEAYVVNVRDSAGTPVQGAYVVLCAADGREISWLPYVTNMGGKVEFSEGLEEKCYVKVVAVPAGYKLEEGVKYTFTEEGNVTIVLSGDDSVNEYVAKIGENQYSAFASALAEANWSREDVTIELLSDIEIKTCDFQNTYGKKITINGNGRTVTTQGGNNAFCVRQTEGSIELKNMTINHKNTGSVVQMYTTATVDLTDVKINAVEGEAYNYCLINILAKGENSTLNLTGVDVTIAVDSKGIDDCASVIRTGNHGEAKKVNINLVDCNLDMAEATGRSGIVVMKGTCANIKLKNTGMETMDTYAVKAVEQSIGQTMTITDCAFDSLAKKYKDDPIQGYEAQIGNVFYLNLEDAAAIASASKEDITIKIVTDFTMNTCTINNVNGKRVLVDGNGRTITTSGGNNVFVVGNRVAFENMIINHKNAGSVVQITNLAAVELTDVEIKATEGKAYNYCLFNMLAKGDGTTLTMNRVNATMVVGGKGVDEYASIVRTGNHGDKKTVSIYPPDGYLQCKWKDHYDRSGWKMSYSDRNAQK